MVALEKAGANAIKARRLRVTLPFRAYVLARVVPDESEGCFSPMGGKAPWLLAGLLVNGVRRRCGQKLFTYKGMCPLNGQRPGYLSPK